LCFFLIPFSSFFGVDLLKVWQEFLRAFDFSDVSNLSAYLRREQFFSLLEGWIDAPLFGHGHGTSASGSLRSDDMPWAYELSYMSLLFHTGLVGVIVYSSSVGWVFWKSIQVVRSRPESAALFLPVLSGLACFLIANATNPYLGKFDYLWTLFLPIGVLNAYLLQEARSK
jgi:O-antigen ligase